MIVSCEEIQRPGAYGRRGPIANVGDRQGYSPKQQEHRGIFIPDLHIDTLKVKSSNFQ